MGTSWLALILAVQSGITVSSSDHRRGNPNTPAHASPSANALVVQCSLVEPPVSGHPWRLRLETRNNGQDSVELLIRDRAWIVGHTFTSDPIESAGALTGSVTGEATGSPHDSMTRPCSGEGVIIGLPPGNSFFQESDLEVETRGQVSGVLTITARMFVVERNGAATTCHPQTRTAPAIEVRVAE